MKFDSKFRRGYLLQPTTIGQDGAVPVLLRSMNIAFQNIANRFLRRLLLHRLCSAQRPLEILAVYIEHDGGTLRLLQIRLDVQSFAQALGGRILVFGRHVDICEADIWLRRERLQTCQLVEGSNRLIELPCSLLGSAQCVE